MYTGKGKFTYAADPQLLTLNNNSSNSTINNSSNSTPSTNNSNSSQPTSSNTSQSIIEVICPFSTYNFATSRCQFSQDEQLVFRIILYLLSTPDVVLLVRLSPLAIIIDELSYYSYHTAHYDRGFRFLVDKCWELNNEKWVPPFLNSSYQTVRDWLQVLNINDWANITPQRFIDKQ